MKGATDAGQEGLPVPFQYSTVSQRRRHGPRGYAAYQEYKPWLRDDFTFRCVYCLVRERWYPDGLKSFSIDHVVPQVSAPGRVDDYRNMVYACAECNSAKQDLEVLDPTKTALSEHVRVLDDGSIQALTPDGQDLIDQLGLDRESRRRVRRYYLDVLSLKREYPDDPRVHKLFIQKYAYPEDLPDLARKRPPGGNLEAGSERESFHHRRLIGKLAPYY